MAVVRENIKPINLMHYLRELRNPMFEINM
jgi:hypothetical protein